MITSDNWADAEVLWDYQHMGQAVEPCSVALGLGSHDLGVADVAARLYLTGTVPLLVFTGATSATTRERMPRGEAEHYRERAVALGVPPRAILVEPEARNTGENIRFSLALLDREGIEVRSALLACKPYEERRAYATAQKLWPEVRWRCVSSSESLREYADRIGDARLVLDMLVGAHQRVLVYPTKGFAVEQQVPEAVTGAYERLCDAEFTGRLL
ncbi:YdcF family protein [Streptomyces sp. GZWMJZ-114]|uniref:YdcF family protein n=1 Tax=Streptomyces sp. GZWMJZ-114 TaxID=2494734 RepID=UPI0010110914|nr:YdcF family protein [Streptomyces sp. GZWMJZ-114]